VTIGYHAGFLLALLGLAVFAVGSMLFGVAAGRDRTLPVWGTLPFAIGALCGLISFSGNLGRLGAALWILFGLAWAWLGLACSLGGISRSWGRKQTAPINSLGSIPRKL